MDPANDFVACRTGNTRVDIHEIRVIHGVSRITKGLLLF